MHVVSCGAALMFPDLLFLDSLKKLAIDFYALELDGGDAQLVVRWLKVCHLMSFQSILSRNVLFT
jgi:hypothetical protein